MLVPLFWLKEYVPITISPEKLAEKLVMHGLEVEKIIDRRAGYDKVVVGETLAVKPHPNADKLKIVAVRLSPNGQPQEIVCGAPNVAAGQKVPVALVGAKLPNGMTIESRPIRGVVSAGMICAEDELGLGTNHAGIIVLDAGIPVGTPLVKAMALDEVVLDFAIPANRPDLLSIIGLAWEIAAILGVKFQEPKTSNMATKLGHPITVKVTNPKLCPLYTARLISGVKVSQSPEWIKRLLRASGMRPINAIVDATNYIMWKYGQPMHAFDAAKVYGAVSVRPAKTGETLKTLDGQIRQLDPSMLIIADTKGPIALAGIMGGQDTEISAATKDIILEAAIFDPVSIRRTSRRLGLVSEASKRFEKGLPTTLPDVASRNASQLIIDGCGGKLRPGVTAVGKAKTKPIVIPLEPKYVSELLGMGVTSAEIKRVLVRLGFKVGGTAKKWKVTVPEWRLDVTLPEDIIDEVGRMVGYEKLPSVMPSVNSIPKLLPSAVRFKDKVRDILCGLQLTEVITHTYYGQSWAGKNSGRHFEIANPLDKAQQYLRKSLAQQMNSILTYAADAGHDAAVFQIGRIFDPTRPAPIANQQPWKLTIGLAFKARPGYVRGRKILGLIDTLNKVLGVASRGSARLATTQEKGRNIELCEIDLTELASRGQEKKYQLLHNYPASERDLSVRLPAGLTYAQISDRLLAAGRPLLQQLEVIDAIEDHGQIGLTIRLIFRGTNRTLAKDEVDRTMAAITKTLVSLAVVIR